MLPGQARSQWRTAATCLVALLLSEVSLCWSFSASQLCTRRFAAQSYRTTLFETTKETGSQESPTASVSEKAALELAESATAAIEFADKVYSSSAWARLVAEAEEFAECIGVIIGTIIQPDSAATVETIVKACDEIDQLKIKEDIMSRNLSLRRRVLEFRRYQLMGKLLRCDYDAYVATASFLSPSRIPRIQLPNVQDVPYAEAVKGDNVDAFVKVLSIRGEPLIADCELDDVEYTESALDQNLLWLFRRFVEKNTGGISSNKPGILGLLEQGRTFMLQDGQTPEAQHKMVKDTLGDLMTPVLPPFYRIFMSGIVPKLGTEMDGKQLGPWFYAPWLTSVVTPTFFGFLVGPSRPNLRKDGQLGGLIVEKCKFLQESGCKGLCLHQCKIPAQEFFQEELGLPLTVSANFVTQECQWSFGETPLPVSSDPTFPSGCLAGCKSRDALASRNANACSY